MVSSARRTRSLKAAGFFAVTVTMLLAPLQGIAHADASPDPSITVTVQKPGGSDTLPNADVTLYDNDGNEVDEGTTDGFGMFTFDRLSGTSYKVGVDKNGYAPWYYDNEPDLDSADTVDLTGTPTQSITAQLTASHVISGHVTLPSGANRDDLFMEAMTLRNGDWVQVTTDSLDGDDDYALSGLPDGSYRVAISGGQSFPEVWYDGATTAYDIADATTVTVAGANVSGKDIVANPPSVSGTVTDAQGDPIQDASVSLHDSDYNWYFDTQTDASGDYTIYSAPGTGNELEFNADGYDQQYFDHTTDESSATKLTLTAASHLTGKDAQLSDSTETNVITGKVTGPGGLPIDGADVELYDSDGEQIDTAVTGSRGRYTLYVDDGDYKLHLTPDSGSSTGLHDQWYGGTDQASATVLTVNGDAQTADFQMTGGGTVSGTVTGTGGAALAGIDVTVYQYDPDEDWWMNGATAKTDASGHYTVVAPAGNVHLQFSGTSVADEYYDNATDLSDSSDVHVAAGASVTGIDASMTTLTKVTGTVTSGGDPVQGADVSFDSDDASYYASANALGKYTAWVAPGTYTASASADGFSDARQNVTVGASSPQTGVDFALSAYGWVTGRVLGAGGSPVVGASVEVDSRDGDSSDGTTNSQGAYRIYVAAATGYKLAVSADGYIDQYYKNARTPGASTPFDVSADAGTTLDDMTLARAGSLAGTVTRGVDAIPGAKVTVYERNRANRDGWSRVDSTVADGTGAWSIGDLDPAVTYHVGVQADSQEQFASGAANVRAGTDYTVPSGGVETVDVDLGAATHLTGTVSASANDAPVADATVTVQRKHTDRFGKFSWQAAGSALTTADGSYDVLASPGTYRLKVTDSNGDLLTSWYTADGSWSSHKQDAAEIDATSGDVSGLDVAMPAGNTISGILTVDGAESDDAWADAYISDGNGGWNFAGEAYASDAAGHYEITGLLPGTYRVAFGVRGAPTTYFKTAGNVSQIGDAEDIVFADLDGTKSGVDADLVSAPTRVVDGTVTDSSHTALEDVSVEIDVKQPDGSWEYDNDTWTDSDGDFSFDEPDGDYRVSVITDGVHAGTTRDLTVAGSDVHLGQIALDDVATHAVHGTITGTSGPLSGASVMLCASYDDSDVADYDCDDWSVSTVTDANGGYSLDGVDGRSYVLIVSDDAGGYAESKQPVHLDGDKLVDVTLQKAGSITGSVSSPGGVDGNFEVDVYSFQDFGDGGAWDYAGYDYVSSGSTYSVTGLAPGTYRICLDSYDDNLTDECYNDVLGGDVSTADDVQVAAGQATTIDFALPQTFDLHGAVTDSVTHEKLDDVDVTAFAQTGQGDWTAVGSAFTSEGDDYDMLLPAGDYALAFSDEDGDYPYTVLANPLASQLDDADLVHVGGDTTKDVALVKGGSIAGTVKWNVTSSKYNWFTTVSAVDTATGDVAQTATVTSGDPYYALMGLAQGTYRLDFARSSSQRLSGLAVPEAQFGGGINEGDGPAGASNFAVTSGSTTTSGTDATLHNGLVLSGAITSPNDVPLAGCVVTAYTDDGHLVNRTSTYSDGSGHYDLGGLTNGSYKLRISDGDGSGACGQGDRYLTNLDGSTGTSSAAVAVPISRTGENQQDITYGDPVPQLQNTGLPAISGAAVPGTTLHASDGTWTPSDGLSFTYQWFDGGVVPISTSSDYQVQPGDVGKQLTVTVTASRDGYQSASATSDPVTVQSEAVSLSGTPTVTGTAEIGGTLTVSGVTPDPADAVLHYQWRRDGSPVGTDSASYALGDDDGGTNITVTLTGKKSGLADSDAVVSAAVAVAKGTITHTGSTAVTGTAEVGQLLTAPTLSWTPADVTIDYQWLRDGATIGGATGSTYSVAAGDAGSKLSVRMVATREHYDSATVVSDETSAVPEPVVPSVSNVTAPTVRGTAQVGQRLTATAGTWDPSDVTLTFQWLRNGVAIPRATSTSYVLTATDLGKLITVRVTATKSGMTTATADSTPPLKIAAGKISGAKPKIKGKAKPGKKLKAVAGKTSPSGVKVKYQWLRNGKVIKKATKASYKLTKKDKGKKISVRVTRTKAGYKTLTLTSKKVKVKKK